MDSPETALHTVAAVEATIHKNEKTDSALIVRGEGM
jgi:hypothetical protein